MLTYPQISPIAFQIGIFKVHWYGLMYLLGIALTWVLARRKCQRSDSPIHLPQVGDAIFYGALGVILGGRLGYMLFYDFSNFVHHPAIIIQVWDGGMSFHGGLIGVIVAMILYSRAIKVNPVDLTDFFAPFVPIGLGAGRIGNFINGELYGRVTQSPLGMVFPKGGPLPRYPSQIFEFLLEGVLLFIVLMWFSTKPRSRGLISACFLIFYAIFRFSAEFFRQPDPQLGYVLFGWMTQGQILCVPMFIVGVFLLFWSQGWMRFKSNQNRKDEGRNNI